MSASTTSSARRVDKVHVMGFGRRLGAQVIDAIIVIFLTFIIGVLISLLGLTFQMFNQDHGNALQPAILLGAVIASFAYYVGMWATQGQTIGKSTLGMTIVNKRGEKLSWGSAILRYIGYMISSLVFGLGFLWIAFDKHRQGWHDKIAGTYVINSDDDINFGDAVEFVPADAGRGWVWLVIWAVVAILTPVGSVAAWFTLGPVVSRMLMGLLGR